MYAIRYAILAVIGTIIISCKRTVSKDNTDPIVASVYRVNLYQSELNSIIHPAVNKRDSAALAKAYIDQWVKDQILMSKASSFSVDNQRINRLVEDYKKKLIKFEYENQIIAERLDTVVSDLALKSFYKENKEQFILSEPLYNIQIAEIIADKSELKKLYTQWGKDDAKDLANFSKISLKSSLDTTVWMTWQEIEAWSDKFSERKAQRVGDQRVRTENSEIFLKVRESRPIKDFSPLPYVTIQLKQMILHKRKLDLLERRKDELYNRALESNEIKIFVE